MNDERGAPKSLFDSPSAGASGPASAAAGGAAGASGGASAPIRPSAVVLLSGGLDSATVLAVARHTGYLPHAMTFRYGQRHDLEIDAARRVAERAGVGQHVVVDIDLRAWGGSALTGDLAVPKDRDLDAADEGIPVTYVPARNTIFLAFATAWAEVLGARAIFIGVNALDYSGYPDCRPEFITAFARMANLATRAGVEAAAGGGLPGLAGGDANGGAGSARSGGPLTIEAPLQFLTKAQIIELGGLLGVDYSLTSSCYDPTPEGLACGRCDACQLRLRGFELAGATDPIGYVSRGIGA